MSKDLKQQVHRTRLALGAKDSHFSFLSQQVKLCHKLTIEDTDMSKHTLYMVMIIWLLMNHLNVQDIIKTLLII